MTVDRDFKRLVRARSARTGESYQAALRSLLARAKEENVSYSAAAIAQPTTLAEIRQHPTNFIVDVGNAGVTHLCLEVVANAVDEVVAGHATMIDVTVDHDGCTVTDNGRGIPIEVPTGSDRSAAELVVAVPGTSAKRRGESYRLAGGFNGLGRSVVAALSRRLELTIDRDRDRYRITFESTPHAPAVVTEPLHRSGPAERRSGTAVAVHSDPDIFGSARPDLDWLSTRLRDIAALHPGLTLRLRNGVTNSETDLTTREGLSVMVPAEDRAAAMTGRASTTAGEAEVVVAPASVKRVLRSFVNDLEMVDGDHLSAIRTALPVGEWHIVAMLRVSAPAYEAVEGGYVAHGRRLGELARAAAEAAVATRS